MLVTNHMSVFLVNKSNTFWEYVRREEESKKGWAVFWGLVIIYDLFAPLKCDLQQL